MSDIGIGALSTANDTGFTSTALGNLDKETFLKLLVAQMKYQNPLSPVDSNEYLAQAAQYASVEQLENVAKSQAALRSISLVSIATDLVGKQVTAADPLTGEDITGVVSGVRFGAEPILIIDGYDVPLAAVTSVTATAAGSPTFPPATPPAAEEPPTTGEPPVVDQPPVVDEPPIAGEPPPSADPPIVDPGNPTPAGRPAGTTPIGDTVIDPAGNRVAFVVDRSIPAPSTTAPGDPLVAAPEVAFARRGRVPFYLDEGP